MRRTVRAHHIPRRAGGPHCCSEPGCQDWALKPTTEEEGTKPAGKTLLCKFKRLWCFYGTSVQPPPPPSLQTGSRQIPGWRRAPKPPRMFRSQDVRSHKPASGEQILVLSSPTDRELFWSHNFLTLFTLAQPSLSVSLGGSKRSMN